MTATYLIFAAFVAVLATVAFAVSRTAASWAATSQAVNLRVGQVVHETDDTVSIYLDVPEQHRGQFEYVAGQYVTLFTKSGGRWHRRAYSLASSPFETDCRITVKRVPGGLVSEQLVHSTRPGDILRVLPPQGRFAHALDLREPRTFYLHGAGSGIVPLRSLLITIARGGVDSPIHLLYANQRPDSRIYGPELDQLADQGTISLDQTFSQLPADDPWQGPRGRVDRDVVQSFLTAHPPTSTSTEPVHLLCGPAGYVVDSIREALLSCEVAEQHIRIERFAISRDRLGEHRPTGERVAITAILHGETLELTGHKGLPVTDSLENAGYEPPLACQQGTCSACAARLTHGSVEMKINQALTNNEVADGLILTCHSLPLSTAISLNYDTSGHVTQNLRHRSLDRHGTARVGK